MATEQRLIDANELENHRFPTQESLYDSGWNDAIDAIMENSPTVDAVEVVHGRWEWYTDRCEDLFLGCDDEYGWRCSKCKVPLDDEDDPEVMPTFRYCPNCGAKMDG